MITKRLVALLFGTVSLLLADAQNINTPNKMGPMGLQVNTLTGNLFIARSDLYIPARGIPLNISFFYNSVNYEDTVSFGRGWNFFYNIRYHNDSTGIKRIVWGEGREDLYYPNGGTGFISSKGIFDSLYEYQAGKFLLKDQNGIKFYFDNGTHRKITRIEDPNNRFLNFQYTDSLLTSIVSVTGQTVSLTYENGKLNSITDANTSPARSYSYSYDDAGNLIRVTDPLNNSINYAYIVSGPMKSVTDKNNNLVDIIYTNPLSVSELIGCNKRISFSYDTLTLITYVTDHMEQGGNQVTKYEYRRYQDKAWLSAISGNCCGFNLKFEFDANGNKISETDANGQLTKYTYDNRGNIVTITDPLNQKSSYTYSADFNQITSYKDPNGFVTSMTYDTKGNLTQLVEPGNLVSTAIYNGNGEMVTSTDPKGNIVTYTYDSYGNPTTINAPHGNNAILNFNARGNLLSLTDSRGNTNTLEYDLLNRLKKVTDPLLQILSFTYDAEGNQVTTVNENNETSSRRYDASNRLVEKTNVAGKKSYASYDAMNNLSSITNELGNSMLFKYDTKNRLSSITDAEGNRTTADYDGNGNITLLNLPNGQKLSYNYDALSRLTAISDLDGILDQFAYDKNNNITSYTNAAGASVTVEYDSSSRVKKLTDPLGNSFQFGYDKNGNTTSVIDRNGFTTTISYDSLDRIKVLTDQNGFSITPTYDVQGHVASLKDQNNNVTTYTYDNLDRVKRITYPDTRYIEYNYDAKGNAISRKLTDGTTISFVYDSLNRLVSKTLPGGHVYSYTYDAFGRMLTATNNSGTVHLAYDVLNRLISETFNGKTIRYSYNIVGRSQTTLYPDSTSITKNFDSRGRLTSISKNNSILVSYQYNTLGQVIGKTYGNGLSTNMQYDFANRLTNITTASGVIQNTSFAYNNEQNKTSINRLNNPAKSEQFTYDNGRRLTNYKRGIIGGSPVIENSYNYDAVGNRTSAVLNGVNTSYTSNNLNQLTNSNNGVQNINFNFDNNGNLSFDGLYYKTHDAEGKLLKDSSSPSNVLRYEYDALNRRVQTNINGAVVNYTFAGLKPVEERDGSGSLINRTIFSNFITPVANERNNQLFYYHQNELNSVEAISNQQGRLVEKYDYDVFGKLSRFDSSNNPINGSLTGNRFGFTGQVFDSATNSYKFFFREYNPSIGLFSERDPIGYGDGMGMYQYVHNNPANGIDVLGLDDCPEETILRDQSRAERLSRMINLYNGHFGNIGNLISTTELGGNKTLGNSKLLKGANYLSSVVNLGTQLDLFNRDLPNMSSEEFNTRAAEIEANMVYLAADVAGDVGGNKSPAMPLIMAAKVTGKIDAASQEIIGKSLSRLYSELDDRAQSKGREMALKMPGNQKRFDKHEEFLRHIVEKHGTDRSKWQDDWNEIAELHIKAYEAGFRYSKRRIDCPQNGNGGSQKPPKWLAPLITFITEVISSLDPNEIIGPEGVGDKKWVSINDRLPYTVTYENDKSATAPAKFVKVVVPIHGKMDPSSFQLGSFGFNSLTFNVPAGAASHYQRLDCRDSLGLFVDVIAGYDQIKNQAFWEFQSIDPITLLAPADPLKGFLLRQDSASIASGHGFVNFSIKPVSSAHTLDSVIAKADIIFDSNDTIPTNIEKNTIDALAPVSSIQDLPNISINTEVGLKYTGQDDPNGSGVHSFSIFVSDNNSEPELYVADFNGKDTTFIGVAGHTYKFYLRSKDSTGNIEPMTFVDSIQIASGETKICPGGSTVFDSKMIGFNYQWQVNTGNGYVNINNGGVYSGVNSAVLNISNAPTSMYGNLYRCIVNGTRYSNIFLLKFEVNWQGSVSSQWENPANWGCGTLPDENTDVLITGGKSSYPVLNSNATIRTLRINNGATATVNAGFTLTLKK